MNAQRIGKMETNGGSGTLQDYGYERLNIIDNYKVDYSALNWLKDKLKDCELEYMQYLKEDQHIVFDALVEGDSLVSCSGIFKDKKWKNHYRLCNRMYVMPKYRRNASQMFHVKNISKHQYERYYGVLENVFISLRNDGNFRVLRRISQVIDDSIDWDMDDRFYNTVPGEMKKSCWQNIIKYGDIDLQSMSKDEYEKLPE